MTKLKLIFGRVWAVWGILLFVMTMLVFMIPFLLIRLWPEPQRTRIFIATSKLWMQIFLHGIGCPITVKGKANFAEGENYIVVCNHNSLMDVPVSCPFIPGGNKTIAKTEFAKVPLFGMIYKMGSVLVDRKSEKSRRESYFKMKEVLSIGLHMAIYPEGTRNQTGEPLKSFHDGAFRLALETGKPVIPALLFNTGKVLPPSKGFYLMPKKLRMHFLEPEAITPEITQQELKEKVFRKMYDYYTANYKP